MRCRQVIQRRISEVSFNLKWDDYRVGFGARNDSFWLGNEWLYRMTSRRRYELRVELSNKELSTRFADYDYFAIGNASTNYALRLGDYQPQSTAGDLDSLRIHQHSNKHTYTLLKIMSAPKQ